MRTLRQVLWLTAMVALVLAGRPALAAGEGARAMAEVSRAQVDPMQVRWEPQVEFERLVLTVSMPGGAVVRREFTAGQTPVFDLARESAVDGSYNWELRVVPHVDPGARRQLAAARRNGDVTAELRMSGPTVQSGSFVVANGTAVRQDAPEERAPRVQTSRQVNNITAADQVIPDDLIVQGSACVGLDCVNNESFGFDTIRLKENNTRIKFDDTSSSTGFPANDWQLTANDSASGGSSKFSIEDITGSKVPFTVTAGAATNSIFVDSTGRVGLRTSTPVLDLHINTSNTPAIRLEQNNSGGFTAQTWDIAGNEANFFVRDVTGGSRLPFRIRPGAPTSSIDINASGNVGIGTASPSVKLHVSGSDGTTTETIQETSGTAAARTLLTLTNNGDVKLNYVDSSLGTTWGTNSIGGDFKINKAGTGVQAFTLTGAGTLTVVTLVQSSDRDSKRDFLPVEGDEVLTKLAKLPISTWTFKADDSNVRHLGPMAQDFSALFGLGADDKHIAPLDVASVSLAGVQALNRKLQEKDAAVAALQQANADLAKRLAELEVLVAKLAPVQN